jgi:hypothetical protein
LSLKLYKLCKTSTGAVGEYRLFLVPTITLFDDAVKVFNQNGAVWVPKDTARQLYTDSIVNEGFGVWNVSLGDYTVDGVDYRHSSIVTFGNEINILVKIKPVIHFKRSRQFGHTTLVNIFSRSCDYIVTKTKAEHRLYKSKSKLHTAMTFLTAVRGATLKESIVWVDNASLLTRDQRLQIEDVMAQGPKAIIYMG